MMSWSFEKVLCPQCRSRVYARPNKKDNDPEFLCLRCGWSDDSGKNTVHGERRMKKIMANKCPRCGSLASIMGHSMCEGDEKRHPNYVVTEYKCEKCDLLFKTLEWLK